MHNHNQAVVAKPPRSLLDKITEALSRAAGEMEQLASSLMDSKDENLGNLEEGFFKSIMEVAREALERAAQKKADSFPFTCLKCGRPLSRKRRAKTTVQTRFGLIAITRSRGFCHKCKEWSCPADLVLGIENGRTPYVEEMAALFASKMPLAEAVPVMRRSTGIFLPRATLGRAVRATGERALAKRSEVDQLVRQGLAARPPLKHEPPFTLVLQIDAWNIRERGAHWGQSQALRAQGEKPEWWHWVYTATVFKLSDRVKTEGGRPVILSRGYACTRGGIDALREQLHAEALRHGLGRAERILIVADGAVWIWNLAEDRFKDAVQRLDLYHAKQHLWSVAAALHGEGTAQAREWIKPLEEQLESGEAAKMISSLEELLPSLKEEARKKIEKEVNYFKNNAGRMDYADAKKRGEPCGSGPIESTCAQYQRRFKCTGQFWTKEGDESLICIQTFWRNDRWQELFPHSAPSDLSKN